MTTCITGGFGSGVSTALLELAAVRESPLVLGHPRDMVAIAVEIIGRHDRQVTLLDDAAVVARLAALRDDTWAATGVEVAATVMAYEASFLGREELRVHADAAGVLERWDGLAALAEQYLADDTVVDRAGALVRASLLLRDPTTCAAERARWDAVVIDDYEQAGFAEARLLTQLAGPASEVGAVVGGNVDAAMWPADGRYLAAFPRRFGDVRQIHLDGSHRRPRFPHLRLFDEPVPVDEHAGGHVIDLSSPSSVDEALGKEWPSVLLVGCQDGVVPGPDPTRDRFFDLELLHGPDVPDDQERSARWIAAERRRFAVACSRATEQLTVLAWPPVTPFITDLVG